MSIDYSDPKAWIKSELAKARKQFSELTASDFPSGQGGLSVNYQAKHDELLNRIAFLENQLIQQQPPVEFVSQGFSP